MNRKGASAARYDKSATSCAVFELPYNRSKKGTHVAEVFVL